MTYDTLLVEIAGPVARVTINRPEKLNALNDGVIHELDEAFAALESDPDVRGILLTGAGTKAFVAGADISELAEQSLRLFMAKVAPEFRGRGH